MTEGLLFIPKEVQISDTDEFERALMNEMCKPILITAPANLIPLIRYVPPPPEPLLWEGDNS